MIRAQPIALGSAPKHSRTGQHRTCSARQTWRKIRGMLDTVGITRLADITGLDRIGIPTFSVVRPIASRFGVTVTCGKGFRGIDAMVGSVMEAIEYKVSEPNDWRGVVSKLGDLDGTVVDPASLILPKWVTAPETRDYEWLEGWDIARDEAVWVPAATVFSEDCRGDFMFETNTNGVASGNTMEEAICHALAEVIERDCCSIAQAHLTANADDPRYASIDFDTVPESCQGLVQRYRDAGLELYVRDFTNDLGIPCFEAACLELHADNFLLHGGSGAHPIAEIALIRALTEAAQSRVADIQGSREDLSVIRRRAAHEVPRESWVLTRPELRNFGDVPANHNDDVRDDILMMIERLAAAGMDRVIVVDISDESLGIPTCRVVVPGLECWEVDHWRIGPRMGAE